VKNMKVRGRNNRAPENWIVIKQKSLRVRPRECSPEYKKRRPSIKGRRTQVDYSKALKLDVDLFVFHIVKRPLKSGKNALSVVRRRVIEFYLDGKVLTVGPV